MDTSIKNKGLIYITARERYVIDGLRASGYTVLYPYKERTLLGRVLRELWFKLHLPEKVWYSKKCLKMNPEKIILHDPLITRGYIDWLREKFPMTSISFDYQNLVGRAKHLTPSQIPKDIRITTYDKGDSDKYNIELRTNGEYAPCYIGEKKPIKYDVFFVGADKGRGEYLLNLQKEMNALGLSTKFIITADGRFSRRKAYYSKRIPYSKVIEYDNESRAILNISMPGQVGLTLRDLEAAFNKVKLITDNVNIRSFDLYKEENVFILGERELKELPEFLLRPYVDIDSDILNKYLLPPSG